MTTLLTRRFTVKDYHRILETGILTDDDRVELIRGEIIQLSPISPRHAGHVKRLPTVKGYLSVQKFYRGQQVSFRAFPEVMILVDEVLG